MEHEWRVVTLHPRPRGQEPTRHVESMPNEKVAEEWVEIERGDYPHATVTIERREVGPWEPVREQEKLTGG